jgi:hypothetical protein
MITAKFGGERAIPFVFIIVIAVCIAFFTIGTRKDPSARRRLIPKWEPPDDTTSGTLNYESPATRAIQRKPTATGLQFFAGVAAYVLSMIFMAIVLNSGLIGNLLAIEPSSFFLPMLIATLIGLAVASFWLRTRYNWSAFLPGVLLGIALTCLVPIGILIVTCGR